LPPRITQIHSIGEYPHTLGDDQRAQLQGVFERYQSFMKNTIPGIYASAGDHVPVSNSWSQMMHHPEFARAMIDLCDVVLNGLPWAQRVKVRELAIITVYQRQRCDYAYRAHYRPALAAGISEAQLLALPEFRTSDHFDDEERTVIEFTHAVLDGHVTDELFGRARALYGEKEMLEFTTVIAYWAFWGTLISALQPDFAAVG
jgi:alkylhydroperoxidase family enzyme